CGVYVGSTFISSTSFALYSNAIGVVLQALFLIFFSALADHGYWRNRYILFFTILGGLVCSLYSAIPDKYFGLLTIFTIVGNFSSAVASAFYYSYLPIYSSYNKDTIKAKGREDYYKVRDGISNKLSANSFSLGMIGAFLVTICASAISLIMGSSPFALQLAGTLNGIWWLVLGLVSYRYFPKEKQPDLPPNSNLFTFTISQLYNSLVSLNNSLDIWLALLSWFFISDGLSTAMYISIFVGRTNLTVTATNTLFLSAFAPLAEGVGMTLLYYIKNRFQAIISTKKMVIFLTILCTLLTLWGILGHYTNVGIKSKGEFYAYYILLVTFYATLQSFHRVMFAEIVPKGRESECFGVYLISYKGTSWIGSLTVGAIVAATNQVRLGYFFVLGLFFAGLVCVFFVNVNRAQKNA
ncbi:MFS general substrate transporter, partial [Neoconidiobolus thromboides FSU 785]